MADEVSVVKPGWKSTEFWLTLASVVVGLLLSSGLVASGSSWDKIVGLIASVLGSLGYTISRGMVKRS